MEDLPKPQADLPLPEKDLPLAEKEITAHSSIKNVFKLNRKWLILGTIIVVILLIGLATAYVLKINNTNKETACSLEVKICPDGSSVGRTGPACEFASCPTPTPDPTADWKTYSYPDLPKNISIKIPSDWNTKKSEGDYTIYKFYSADYKEGSSSSALIPIEKGILLYIYLDSFQTYDDFLESSKKSDQEWNYQNKEELDLNGIKAFLSTGSLTKKYFRSSRADIYYQGFSYRIYLDSNVENNQDTLFKNILTTFKFTNASPTPNDNQTVCTQDAMQCPNGSWVGRTGANCEFKCPTQ